MPDAMPSLPHVYMLTWCRDASAIYGSVLTFKTLRTGFPTAPITVVDNASIPGARLAIRAAAQECRAAFVQLETEIRHQDFMVDRVLRHPGGPLVFLDPDLCFWRSVEDWRFDDCLLAGRLLPTFRCEFTQTLTHARLHTSFLWTPDVTRLRAAVLEVSRERLGEWYPLSPTALVLNGRWHRFDTGASLYAALPAKMRAFTELELDAYDHLFVGSHLATVAPKLLPEDAARLTEAHERVRAGDLTALRGAWRWQQEMFERRRSTGVRTRTTTKTKESRSNGR